jgi:transposase
MKEHEEMGYRPMNEEKVYQIFRRWHARQSISEIKEQEGCDRKTIRYYVTQLEALGFTRDKEFPGKEMLCEAIRDLIPKRTRPRDSFKALTPYEDELKELINNTAEGVLPKTAYEIIKERDGLSVSYESFKRFARERSLGKKNQRLMIRIEMPPGIETQIDYGKAGLHYDRVTGRNRVVYVFCGVLSHSRLPFVQFVYTQEQQSFVGSIVDMFEYYGGTTTTLAMDNLKSGVVKPDLWEPKLNKSCAEMAERYGVFIDPCRVATPTDKGKVERFVGPARELFRKLKKLHHTADIHTLNREAIKWCREEYGRREHGTIKQAPMDVFESAEKPLLQALPPERFEVPRWKEVPVHPDQFFEYSRKRYSLPSEYRQKKVWIRESGRILRVFYEHKLIREYRIASRVINPTPEDFPEAVREMMNGGYPRYLLTQSEVYGDCAYRLIESVLAPHAYINSRRAQGLLRVMKEYAGKPYFNEVCASALEKRVKLPKTFKLMLETAGKQMHVEVIIETSGEGRAMIRPITDFFN